MDPLVYCGQLKTLNLCLSHPAPCHLGGIGCTATPLFLHNNLEAS